MSNAFDTSGPSIVGEQLRAGRRLIDGKSRSQIATEEVARRKQETGVNPGTIAGLAPEHKGKKRAPGHFR